MQILMCIRSCYRCIRWNQINALSDPGPGSWSIGVRVRDGMGWDGMGWDGMGWDRMGLVQDTGTSEYISSSYLMFL